VHNLHILNSPPIPFLEEVADVLGDDGSLPLKQFRHLRLRQPDRLALQPNFQPRAAVRRLVEGNWDFRSSLMVFAQLWAEIPLLRPNRRTIPACYAILGQAVPELPACRRAAMRLFKSAIEGHVLWADQSFSFHDLESISAPACARSPSSSRSWTRICAVINWCSRVRKRAAESCVLALVDGEFPVNTINTRDESCPVLRATAPGR